MCAKEKQWRKRRVAKNVQNKFGRVKLKRSKHKEHWPVFWLLWCLTFAHLVSKLLTFKVWSSLLVKRQSAGQHRSLVSKLAPWTKHILQRTSWTFAQKRASGMRCSLLAVWCLALHVGQLLFALVGCGCQDPAAAEMLEDRKETPKFLGCPKAIFKWSWLWQCCWWPSCAVLMCI